MDAKQHLYYGLGLIAYAVAGIDGKVQREERETIQRLLSEGIKKVDVDYDVADIIFQIVEKEKADFFGESMHLNLDLIILLPV